MNDAVAKFFALLAGFIGLATVAVILSKNSNTAAVLTSGGTAFGNILKAAVSPVSGGLSFGSFSTS